MQRFFDIPSSHGACISPQSPFEHSRCFCRDTSADGAANLLEVLRNSSPEKLNFEYCDQIPSTAWQKLRGASWTSLKEANFSRCLVLQTSLRCLASLLDAVFFSNVQCHCHSFKWSNLQKSLARAAATRWQSSYRLPREDGIPLSFANMSYCHLQ